MNARDRITSRIADQARRYPDFDLSSLDVSGLDDRDAALARAMEMTTLRRWLTLVTILDNKLAQPWEGLQPAVKAPLLVGSAQLLLLETIPDPAALNEAANWTKRHPQPRGGGLANALPLPVQVAEPSHVKPSRSVTSNNHTSGRTAATTPAER